MCVFIAICSLFLRYFNKCICIKTNFLLTLANFYETINSWQTLLKTYKFQYQNLDRKFPNTLLYTRYLSLKEDTTTIAFMLLLFLNCFFIEII